MVNILKISINGKLYIDNSDQLFQTIDKNSYNSLGDAISHKIADAIHQTDWYNHTPYNFDLVHNFNDVQAICGDKAVCYMDSLNWSIMNKTELTADIYRFITHRMEIVREGIENNLIPDHHLTFGGLLDLIDWHFILDCVSWFF